MATINYNILSGTPPFTVSINPAVASDNIHNAIGAFYFTNIPNGNYTISIIDNEGCTDSFIVNIDCITTTTTSTTEEVTTTTTTTFPCNLTYTFDYDFSTTTSTTTIEPTTTTTTTPDPLGGYGLLYNFATIEDARGVAPAGYRVATLEDIYSLTNYLGGQAVAGGKLKAITDWTAPNTDATDEVGFSGLPVGIRSELGVFLGKLTQTKIWIDNR